MENENIMEEQPDAFFGGVYMGNSFCGTERGYGLSGTIKL